jgi:hypothetical protein
MQRLKGGALRRRSPVPRHRSIGGALALAMLGFAASCAQPAESPPDRSSSTSEDVRPVACLLPGEIDRLGQQLTIPGARQRIETPRRDCLERGGEVIESQAPATEPGDQAR